MARGNAMRKWLAAVAAWLLVTAGCHSLRLPAIDPTGERIFLPPPAYTTLEVPDCLPRPPALADCSPPNVAPNCSLHDAIPCLPKPAYTAPPPPPPCDENGMPPPLTAAELGQESGPSRPRLSDGHHPGVKYGRLVLTPGRIV